MDGRRRAARLAITTPRRRSIIGDPGQNDAIRRDLTRASTDTFDLAIVGGGIYGACLALEAARRGLRPVLLERDDFGGGTSWNSLRIVHGGLRYLQGLDLVRFRESVRERRWYLASFPELTQPLRCLMPLYGRGLKRPSVFSVALALNDLLSGDRNLGVPSEVRLPGGQVVSRVEVARLFPGVRREGLAGGACWYDGVMLSSERVLIEILRWACSRGALALNRVEVTGLGVQDGTVTGLTATDRVGGASMEVTAPVVVNCAGPWSRLVAERCDRDDPELFRASLAMNVLLDRPPPSGETALAVDPHGVPDGRTYFVQPWKGRTLAGTFHAPWTEGAPLSAAGTEAPLATFLAHLNASIPQAEYRRDEVLQVYAGLLPASSPGSDELARRPVIRDHARGGGPRGLWSVAGIKYTTARDVAEKCLGAVYGSRLGAYARGSGRPEGGRPPVLADVRELAGLEPAPLREILCDLIEQESAHHLDDLLLRRLDGASAPDVLERLAPVAAACFGDAPRAEQELARLRRARDGAVSGDAGRSSSRRSAVPSSGP